MAAGSLWPEKFPLCGHDFSLLSRVFALQSKWPLSTRHPGRNTTVVRHCRLLFAHTLSSSMPGRKKSSFGADLLGFIIFQEVKIYIYIVVRKSTCTARLIFKSRSATLLNFADVAGGLMPPKITRDIACGYRRGRGAVDSVPHPIQAHSEP